MWEAAAAHERRTRDNRQAKSVASGMFRAHDSQFGLEDLYNEQDSHDDKQGRPVGVE